MQATCDKRYAGTGNEARGRECCVEYVEEKGVGMVVESEGHMIYDGEPTDRIYSMVKVKGWHCMNSMRRRNSSNRTHAQYLYAPIRLCYYKLNHWIML